MKTLAISLSAALIAVSLSVAAWLSVPTATKAHGPFENCVEWNACANDECGLFYNPCVVNGEYSWSCVVLEACYDSCSDDHPGCVDIDLGDLP